MNKNIAELQLLRGYSVWLVILHHMNHNLFTWSDSNIYLSTFYSYFDAVAGLDMFFALSGFVICRLLLNDLGQAQDRYHSMQISAVFWARRAWRLLPAAWFWLAMAVLLSAFANDSGAFGTLHDTWGGAWTAVLQVANFKFGDCWEGGYFCGPTFPYWSLSLEEQFYIFLPLLMIFSGKWFVRVILVIGFTQFFVPVLTFPPFFRMQGFTLGVLLAVWSRTEHYRVFEPVFLKNKKWASRCVLMFLYLWLSTMHKDVIPGFVLFQLGALCGVLMIFLASFDENYLWQEGWVKRLGLWLGARSYAMYLCHIPVFYLVREIVYRILGTGANAGPEHFAPMFIGACAIILACGHLTYNFVEKPLRQRGMRITDEMTRKQKEARDQGLPPPPLIS